MNTQYDKGWKAREDGVPFDPYTDAEWCRGWLDCEMWLSQDVATY